MRKRAIGGRGLDDAAARSLQAVDRIIAARRRPPRAGPPAAPSDPERLADAALALTEAWESAPSVDPDAVWSRVAAGISDPAAQLPPTSEPERLARAALALTEAWENAPPVNPDAIWAQIEAGIDSSPRRPRSARARLTTLVRGRPDRGRWMAGAAAAAVAATVLVGALLVLPGEPSVGPDNGLAASPAVASPPPAEAPDAQPPPTVAAPAPDPEPPPTDAAPDPGPPPTVATPDPEPPPTVAAPDTEPPPIAESPPPAQEDLPPAAEGPPPAPESPPPAAEPPPVPFATSIEELSSLVNQALADQQLSQTEAGAINDRLAALVADLQADGSALLALTLPDLHLAADTLESMREELAPFALEPSDPIATTLAPTLASLDTLSTAVQDAITALEAQTPASPPPDSEGESETGATGSDPPASDPHASDAPADSAAGGANLTDLPSFDTFAELNAEMESRGYRYNPTLGKFELKPGGSEAPAP